MFEVYLQTQGRCIGEKTSTVSEKAALAAFEELVDRSDLDGLKIIAVLSCKDEQLALHEFDHADERGDRGNFWRGRIGEINLSKSVGGRQRDMFGVSKE